ncbi:hypothetical protein [Ferrimonas balearica]|uniref:hypothetical protein n=1 Tax=Ferrimonas balearica TaxID=44012 RepID=UPI001C9A28DC|nr:hypothetical protein [Ferrimonas balearica]MBY5994116.1 hypothetical protein [Ferrimonas balearica]
MNFNRYKVVIPTAVGRASQNRFDFIGTWVVIYFALLLVLPSALETFTHRSAQLYTGLSLLACPLYYALHWLGNYAPRATYAVALGGATGTFTGVPVLLNAWTQPADQACLAGQSAPCGDLAPLAPEAFQVALQGTQFSATLAWGLHASVLLIWGLYWYRLRLSP